MNSQTLILIDTFLQEYFPKIDAVLFFGSASIDSKSPQDFDLLIISDKLSYMSKSSYKFKGKNMSTIKIPTYDLFNVLANDYKEGTYKNILETGIIIIDNHKILINLKQFIKNDYPSISESIRFNFVKIIPKINETFELLFNDNFAVIEEYLIFNDLINSIINFQLLLDGYTHIRSIKHKARYLNEYHPIISLKLTSIIESFYLNEKIKAKSDLKNILIDLNIPSTINYSNDYTLDFKNSERLFFLIKDFKSPKEIKVLYQIIKKTYPKISFYLYYVDINNVEEEGTYIVFNNNPYLNELNEIKILITVFFKDIIIYFPYNELYFHPEIKFGGKNNLVLFEKLFIKFQNDFFANENIYEAIITFIYKVMKSLKISENKIKDIYFYKNLNIKHNLSYFDILETKSEKEKKYNARISEITQKINLDEFQQINANLFTKKEKEQFEIIPEYFLFQFIDRMISLHFLKDEDKQFFVFLATKIR